jgi:hypothetical protein
MSLFKTSIVGLVVAVATSWLIFGSSLGSVIGTAMDRTRTTIEQELGDEFQLDRAQRELERAEEQIARQRVRVAELRVGCAELEEELTEGRLRQRHLKESFRGLDDAWSRSDEGRRYVALEGEMVGGAHLHSEVVKTANTLRQQSATLDMQGQLLATRRSSLEVAERHLREIDQRRQAVALALETSRVDLECVRLLQQATGRDVEASALASAEEITRSVGRELRVQREMANLAAPNPTLDLLEGSDHASIARAREIAGKNARIARAD